MFEIIASITHGLYMNIKLTNKFSIRKNIWHFLKTTIKLQLIPWKNNWHKTMRKTNNCIKNTTHNFIKFSQNLPNGSNLKMHSVNGHNFDFLIKRHIRFKHKKMASDIISFLKQDQINILTSVLINTKNDLKERKELIKNNTFSNKSNSNK